MRKLEKSFVVSLDHCDDARAYREAVERARELISEASEAAGDGPIHTSAVSVSCVAKVYHQDDYRDTHQWNYTFEAWTD